MRGITRAVAAMAAMAMLGAAVVTAPAAQAANGIVIWTDAAHAPVITQLLPNGYQGTPVSVVVKDPATVRSDLAGIGKGEAPDILWGDLAWTGELASTETLVPISLTDRAAGKFRANVIAGTNVGGKTYGLPVQISNLALITNTKLVPQQPATFADLSTLALKLKKDKKVRVPFALPQSEGTSPYTTFPLFSGVGGYLFGKTKNGSLDPTDLGLASDTLKSNADLIDGWNSSGLIDSTLTVDAAKKAFANSKSAFFLAGPEDLQYLLGLSFAYRIGVVPPIAKGQKAVPLLTVHGFMLTSWAAKHGVEEQAQALLGKFFARPKPQQSLAAAQGWYPANTVAAGTVPTGGGRIRAIGGAGIDGVPMPNIPQAGAIWAPYAQAWTEATAGATAIPAKKAFRKAQRVATASIAQG